MTLQKETRSGNKEHFKTLGTGLGITVLGAVIMAIGLWFSATVNPVSVLGIFIGAQALTLGQLLTLKAVLRIHRDSKKVIQQPA